MNKIKEKLHNNRGASFLFALLAFMVAAMVSVTIIVAAVSSIKRVYNDREEQQVHLALTSAAKFVGKAMQSTRYIKTVEKSGETDSTTTISTEGMFGTEMKNAVEYVDTYKSEYSSNTAFKLKVDDLDIDPVDVTFSMAGKEDEEYKLIFTFSIAGSDETLFLHMEKTETETGGDSDGVTTSITTISWTNPIINGLRGAN